MVIFLYGDKNVEHQAMACIKSLTHKIADDIKIVYYTIGFDSSFEFNNLNKVRIEYKPQYPIIHFYKGELALLTMQMFPNEYYLYTDTDVLFSRNFNFDDHKYNESYPMASYGPHEYPVIWQEANGVTIVFDEKKLMKYHGVSDRTMRYCWACFYAFNPNCKEFFEEYSSICQNKYLLDRRKDYFPFTDETAFNVCLWKQNATKNLKHAFVNTHLLETVKLVEERKVKNTVFTNHLDTFGVSWQSVEDPDRVLLYHGFKEKVEMDKTVNYLLSPFYDSQL